MHWTPKSGYIENRTLPCLGLSASRDDLPARRQIGPCDRRLWRSRNERPRAAGALARTTVPEAQGDGRRRGELGPAYVCAVRRSGSADRASTPMAGRRATGIRRHADPTAGFGAMSRRAAPHPGRGAGGPFDAIQPVAMGTLRPIPRRLRLRRRRSAPGASLCNDVPCRQLSGDIPVAGSLSDVRLSIALGLPSAAQDRTRATTHQRSLPDIGGPGGLRAGRNFRRGWHDTYPPSAKGPGRATPLLRARAHERGEAPSIGEPRCAGGTTRHADLEMNALGIRPASAFAIGRRRPRTGMRADGG